MTKKLKDLFLEKLIHITDKKSQKNMHTATYMLGLIDGLLLSESQIKYFLKAEKIPRNIMVDELRKLMNITT